MTARLLEWSDFIKIVDDDTMYSFGRTLPTLSKDIIQALAAAAHAHGRLAVAHIGTERQAIEVTKPVSTAWRTSSTGRPCRRSSCNWPPCDMCS